VSSSSAPAIHQRYDAARCSHAILERLRRLLLPACGGFLVRRPFPKTSFSEFDPFLLLDEMGPIELAPGEAKGAPEHPHRGFETVSYLLAGDMEHMDSRGHAGRMRAGDVQWMTAGSGVIHAEMPARDFARDGGRMHAFQLWVNLPKRDKMTKPRYQ